MVGIVGLLAIGACTPFDNLKADPASNRPPATKQHESRCKSLEVTGFTDSNNAGVVASPPMTNLPHTSRPPSADRDDLPR